MQPEPRLFVTSRPITAHVGHAKSPKRWNFQNKPSASTGGAAANIGIPSSRIDWRIQQRPQGSTAALTLTTIRPNHTNNRPLLQTPPARGFRRGNKLNTQVILQRRHTFSLILPFSPYSIFIDRISTGILNTKRGRVTVETPRGSSAEAPPGGRWACSSRLPAQTKGPKRN